MNLLGELRVTAEHPNLRIISHFVHGIAHRLSLNDRTLFDLELAVEEAATNIINHAYKGKQTGDLVIGAVQNGEYVEITLTDWGIPLNPDEVKPFDIHAPIETRIKGGMGLHFIHTLMDGVERQIAPELGQPNVLKLYKRIETVTPTHRSPSPLQELNAMRTVSEVITSNIDLDDLLSLILNTLVTTIGAERGTIYLADESHGELWSRVLLDDVGALSEIRLKIGEGIAGHVAATGEVLNISDAYTDSRFKREFDAATGFHTRSILTAPMFNPQQKIIGVVQLLNKHDGPFSARDERLLTAMAAQAAISIENARLYQQELEQRLINQELKTAYQIQTSFLPDQIPQSAGWDIAALWCPVHSVAGDFYDFYWLEDGRLAAVIADVSGKGYSAALFMALSVTVLRFAMSLNLSPSEVTHRANQLIIADQRSRMFATTFIGYIALGTGQIEFTLGGHNPPLVYHAADRQCTYLDSNGVAVGIFKEAKYAEDRLDLSNGDILILYTDGITEVINDKEEEFGEERLADLVKENAHLPAQELADLIYHAITVFSENQSLFDDATLLVIKRIQE